MDPTSECMSGYVKMSKKQIDKLLYHFDYNGAFGKLIMVLNNLDEANKKEIISYYQNYLTNKYGLNGTTLSPAARY